MVRASPWHGARPEEIKVARLRVSDDWHYRAVLATARKGLTSVACKLPHD
jgi:hypothetical protein